MAVMSTSWLFFQLFKPSSVCLFQPSPFSLITQTACNNCLLTSFSSSFEMRPICQAFNRRRIPSSFGEANLRVQFVKKSSHQAFESNSCTLKVCEEIFQSSFGENPSSFEEQNFSPSRFAKGVSSH
jgi:hypothetical protein